MTAGRVSDVLKSSSDSLIVFQFLDLLQEVKMDIILLLQTFTMIEFTKSSSTKRFIQFLDLLQEVKRDIILLLQTFTMIEFTKSSSTKRFIQARQQMGRLVA